MADTLRPLRPLATLAVSIGLATLWLHPGLSHSEVVTLAIMLLWPALALPRPVPWRRWSQAWNAVLALAVGFAPMIWLFAPFQRLEALVVLIALAELRWAYNPCSARQARWMVGLAALAVTLTGLASESPLFAVLAVPFLVTAVATLIVSEVALGVEAAAPMRPTGGAAGPPGQGGFPLWKSPLRLSALVAGIGVGLFLVFPRLGFPAADVLGQEGIETQHALTGMSSQIELGAYSHLLRDRTPAVRVTWLGAPPPEPYYLRGASLSRLEQVQGRWRLEGLRLNNQEVAVPSDTITPLVGSEIPAGAVGQRVELLEPDLRTLFALPWIVGVRGPGGTLVHESGDQWRALNKETRWPVYEVWSSPRTKDLGAEPEGGLDEALLLRPDSLRQRVREFLLSQGIVSLTDPPEQRAQAIIHHLRATHRYSLDLREIRRGDPLEDFLFHPRAGDCEYFATAMAVMCRAVGVPARVATGFHGGEALPEGGRLFRRSDAHAWVEVWTAGRGWMTMDPSPPAPLVVEMEPGLWRNVSTALGDAAAGWRERVVHYEGAWHRRALRWAGAQADRLVEHLSGEPGLVLRAWSKAQHNLGDHPALWVFIAVVVGVNLLLAWIDRRLRQEGAPWRRGRRVLQANEALLLRLASALGAKARPRRVGETPSEYLLRVAQPVTAPPGLHALIQKYYAWRFDPTENTLSARDLVREARALQGR
jgi:transglutaminase-like putative cysteine protease